MDEPIKDLEEYINPRLKPARNVRFVEPRCCGTCKHHMTVDMVFFCTRKDGYGCDTGEGEQWYHVCDLWQGRYK